MIIKIVVYELIETIGIDLYLSDVLYHYSKETVQQLESRINELEQTIENMKSIAGENVEAVASITSVDYPNDETTELIKLKKRVFSFKCYFC